MNTRFLLPVLALLLAGAPACTPQQPGDDPRPQAQGASLRVENQAWLDMTIYVTDAGSGARRRLGGVSGTSNVTLRIPQEVVGIGRTLRFIADPIGSGRTATSYDLFVRPGQRVTITIPPGVGR
jgi:hypothetical protein